MEAEGVTTAEVYSSLGADLTTGVGLVIGEDLEIDGYLSRGGTRAMMVRSTSGDSAAICGCPSLSTDEAAGAKVSFATGAVAEGVPGMTGCSGERAGTPPG